MCLKYAFLPVLIVCEDYSLYCTCGIHRWSRTKQGVFATLGFGCDLKIHHISHTMVCLFLVTYIYIMIQQFIYTFFTYLIIVTAWH